LQGTILDFSLSENTGLITGDDGNRYSFSNKDWKADVLPQKGLRVDFDFNGKEALSIFLALNSTAMKNIKNDSSSSNAPTGLYRSSDEKLIAGVCVGLARKFGVNHTVFRLVFVILSFVLWVPFFAYFLLWIILKPIPTKELSAD
jgi:phage shock protein PspC (stress-responsive transcriptional regulator)